MSFWPQLFDIARRLDTLSYYELLGLEGDVQVDRIDQRYYELARRLHPDRHARDATGDQMAALNRVLARLGEARRVLSTPPLRSEYDAKRKLGVARLETDEGKKKAPAARDPKHPMARQLFEQAQGMAARGDAVRARTTLDLARQYEPASAAIAEALAALPAPPGRRSDAPATVAPVAAPGGAPPAPAAPPVAAAPPATALPVAAPPATALPVAAPPATAPPVAAPPATALPVAAPPATAPPAAAARPATASAAPRAGGSVELDGLPDQRAHPRKAAALPVRLRLSRWEHVELLISRDLSRGGMFLRSAHPLEVGARVELTIETPVGEGVTLLAEVVHVIAPGGGGTPGMGLRFLVEPAEALVTLDQLITRHRPA